MISTARQNRDENPDEGVEDDIDFRSAMADVCPKGTSNRLPPVLKKPSTRPLQREADERAVIEELGSMMFEPELIDSGDTLVYRADGIQDSVWRRLRRGNYRIGAELDLHGMNRLDAHREVSTFLADCQDRGVRAVRIIHGKGRGSPNSGPVIKTLLDGWLRKRKDVLAFCSARAHDGGTGAAYVLLRSAPTRTDQR